MKQIDDATVRGIAALSRLDLTDAEVEQYSTQLSAILDYASHLPELTSETALTSSLRVADDVVNASENPHELLRNAVAMQDGYVKVPAILDKGESGA